MVYSKTKKFFIIIGNIQILIIMSYTSGNSAIKCSEVFGQYDKYAKSYSRSKSSSKRTLFSSPN